MLFEFSYPVLLLIVLVIIIILCIAAGHNIDTFKKVHQTTNHKSKVVWASGICLFVILFITIIVMLLNGSIYFRSRLVMKDYIYKDSRGNRGLYSWQTILPARSVFRGPDKLE